MHIKEMQQQQQLCLYANHHLFSRLFKKKKRRLEDVSLFPLPAASSTLHPSTTRKGTLICMRVHVAWMNLSLLRKGSEIFA